MSLSEYADTEMLALGLANVLAGELRSALGHKDRVLFVVPGGTTPGPVFDALCDSDLDWERVDILLSDERWRPEVHIRSNTRLLRERLLTGRAAAARYLPLYARAERPEDVIDELEVNIQPALPIDVCLLGMGTDMHTAGLIPGADGLEAALDDDAPILCPIRAPGDEEARVTLSARVLAGAINMHVVITGARKRRAVERARQMKPTDAPVSCLLDAATVHWAPEE
jgi:6-phosphogluconolactonase